MEGKKRVYFPSGVERVRRISAGLGELTGDKKAVVDPPGLIDEDSELPDNRKRPLLIMELLDALDDQSLTWEDRSQIVIVLIVPNNAEGLRLHLGSRGYGKHLAMIADLVRQEMQFADLGALYFHRLTEYECAIVVQGMTVDWVRWRIKLVEPAMRSEFVQQSLASVKCPAGAQYYPKVEDAGFLWGAADMTGVVVLSQFFHKCRSELHQAYPFRLPPRVPSLARRSCAAGSSTLYEWFRDAAAKWEANGRQKQDLPQDLDLATLICWLDSPGMLVFGREKTLLLFKLTAVATNEVDYTHTLSKRLACGVCGETYRLENQRFCVECRKAFCFKCSAAFPLTLFNNPECPGCGNELVG